MDQNSLMIVFSELERPSWLSVLQLRVLRVFKVLSNQSFDIIYERPARVFCSSGVGSSAYLNLISTFEADD